MEDDDLVNLGDFTFGALIASVITSTLYFLFGCSS